MARCEAYAFNRERDGRSAGEEDKMILNLDAKFPREVLDMNASADDRYIYCVTEKSIKIYDTEEKAIIHELKKLGNARTAVSEDGRFLGCACPVRGAVQVCVPNS